MKIPLQLQDDSFKMVQDFSEYLKISSEEQEAYDRELDKIITFQNALIYEHEEGFAEGLRDARESLYKEGKAEGLKESRLKLCD